MTNIMIDRMYGFTVIKVWFYLTEFYGF